MLKEFLQFRDTEGSKIIIAFSLFAQNPLPLLQYYMHIILDY